MTTTSRRKRRSTYDRSPMRRVGSYNSPERFRYGDHIPLARRASSEILYGNSSNYLHSSYDYPNRRWSDDYLYGHRSSSVPHFDRFHPTNYTKSSSRKYLGGRQSPRSYYESTSSKSYPSSSYNQKPVHSSTRSRDFNYAFDHYDDRPNEDYYDNRHNKYDRRPTEYQDYYTQEKPPKRNTHPNERRYLLVKDPKDKRISGNGLGMKVVGGKEIPGTNGRLGAYIAKITPGGVVATLGELKEGNLVLEWNGRNLLDKTYEEVQKIISQTSEELEIEISVRGDVDMLNDKSWATNPLQFDHKYYPTNNERNRHKSDSYYHGRNYSTSKDGRDYSTSDPYGNRDYNNPSDQHSRVNYGYRNDGYSTKDYRTETCSGRDYNYKSDPYSGRDLNDPYYSSKNYPYCTNSRNDPYGNRDYNSSSRRDPYDKDYFSSKGNAYSSRDLNTKNDYHAQKQYTSRSDPYINRDYGYKNDQYYSNKEYNYKNDQYSSNKDYNYKNDPYYGKEYGHDPLRRDPNVRDDYSNRDNSSRRGPPYDPLDINGNETAMWKNPALSRIEDEYRNRDPNRSKGYPSKPSSSYSDEGKDVLPAKDKIFDRELYSTQRAKSPSSKKPLPVKDEDYYSDRSERRRRRRRSLESRDSRYYSSRDRDISPEYIRRDGHHRESRSYTPERQPRSHRDRSPSRNRYESERYQDQYPSKQILNSAVSTSNLATSETSHRRVTNSSRQYQDYPDDRNYSQSQHSTSSKQGSRHQSDPRNPSGSQRSSREHKRHSRSNGKSKSRGKLSHGSKQEPSSTSLGQVELQCCYDSIAKILYVTVIKAKGLFTIRDDGDTCPDPFVKVYLLPGRSIENQRRTRHFTRTSDPQWNQTMVYPNLTASDLKKRYLEVTAWNFDNNKPNEFLGEVVLDLSDPMVVNEEPKWYQLQEMVEPDGQQGKSYQTGGK